MQGARVRHRVGQFLRALKARYQPVDLAYVAARLQAAGLPDPDRFLTLFTAMKRADQHHGVDVAQALEQAGLTAPELSATALLHDVGKVRAPMGLFTRVFVVLGEHFTPSLAQTWSQWPAVEPRSGGEVTVPRGLRRGFVVRRHHAQWGARLVEEAGAPQQMVAWIRHHHDAAGADALLSALQHADET